MMNVFKKLVAVLICMVSVFSFVSCKNPGKIEDGEQVLQTYVLDAGYGTAWLDAMLDDFASQDWVKAKYPDLKIPAPEVNDIEGYAAEKIDAGANSHSIDIFFSVAHAMYKVYTEGDVEDISDVYEMTVPGESMTIREKMKDGVITSLEFYDKTTKKNKYYSMPWAGGIDGILYNADILAKLGFEVPLTTNQLIDICEQIKVKNSSADKFADYQKTYSIMASTTTNYWRFLHQEWLAQYEGVKNCENYFDGVYDGALSKEIFGMRGRLETLKVFEDLLSGSNGYLCDSSNILAYMTSQTNLLMGDGIFQANGDWFEREMEVTRAGLKSRGYDYDIRMMKTPIISAIINKTPSIKDDDKLAEVVKAIDEGKTSVEGVDAKDFQTVKDAREVIVSDGSRHAAVIPTTSKAKGVAKDFLAYMATDRANAIYAQNTRGSTLPYKNFDITKTDMYATLSTLQKSTNDIIYSTILDVDYLPTFQNKPLVYYGGLGYYACAYEHLEIIFFDEKKTAQGLFEEEIAYWTEERWDNLIRNAGLL